jgi:hypothetical protein|tara:strand:- start:5881 stop:6507 length:627 start_codon:yes stop_codon:yes gene_type:complete
MDKNIFSIPNNQRTIDSFKSRLIAGGARPNLFEVEMAFPNEEIFPEIGDTTFRMLIKGAALPPSTLTPIEIPFRGRKLKIAGDRVFNPWTIKVVNDNDFKLREAFERWSNFIVKVSDGSGTLNPSDYQVDWIVNQLGRAKSPASNVPAKDNSETLPVLRRYYMKGCFPSDVTQIELNYDSENQVEEFDVTLQIQYWEAYDSEGAPSVV